MLLRQHVLNLSAFPQVLPQRKIQRENDRPSVGHISSKLVLLLLNNVLSDSQKRNSILLSISATSFTRHMHHKSRAISSQLFVFLSSVVDFSHQQLEVKQFYQFDPKQI